jgi:hypothetical protein
MSTDLYGIRVLKTAPQEKKVTVRVFVVYYDVSYKNHQPIPKDHSFFLRILWNKGDTRFGKGGPIGNEINVDQILDESWVDANTYQFIEKVEQLSQSNFPVDDYSAYQNFYYERNGTWENEEKLVQADYDVYVTEVKYMQHLSDGMSWGTTAYETSAFQLMKKYAKSLPQITKPDIKLLPFEGEKEEGTPDKLFFSPDGSKLLAISQVNEVVAYDTTNWKELWRNNETKGMVYDINIDSKKGIIYFTDYGEFINGIDYNTGKNSTEKPISTAKLTSPNGSYFVNFGNDELLKFVDKEGNILSEIEQSGTVEAVAFSSNENLVAIGGMYNQLSVWNIKEQSDKMIIETNARVNSLAFSPCSEFLMSILSEKIQIFNIQTKELVMKYSPANDDYVGGVKWSPDGKYFALTTIYGPNGYKGHVSIYKIGI